MIIKYLSNGQPIRVKRAGIKVIDRNRKVRQVYYDTKDISIFFVEYSTNKNYVYMLGKFDSLEEVKEYCNSIRW